MASFATVKTRICIISDTHARVPFQAERLEEPFRLPLPSADLLLHAGDLTNMGKLQEYQKTISMLAQADAELKLVIAGNHDLSLDASFWKGHTGEASQKAITAARDLWTGTEAREAGIIYLEEGLHHFELKNGASFTIFTSPYTPEFCNWGFAYPPHIDRFNPRKLVNQVSALHPVPSYPLVDIMMTHGPPYRILDRTQAGTDVGCSFLLRAVERCRPLLHCFGHIHEAWGAEVRDWESSTVEKISVDREKSCEERGVFLDRSKDSSSTLRFGEQTLFVNAAIMNIFRRPRNPPWIVDLDLPRREAKDRAQDEDAPAGLIDALD